MIPSSLQLPTISLVTPSFNQAPFLEATLRSIHEQNYPKLEHVVMDGGSTDGSVDILRRHQSRFAFWTTGKDHGQYDAINQGFTHTRGEVMGWLNSDDLYLPWTLRAVGEIFATFPDLQWITSLQPLNLSHDGLPYPLHPIHSLSSPAILRGEFLPGESWRGEFYLQQESTFWRRSLWEQAGGLDPQFNLAGDFALWLRFAQLAPVGGVPAPLAAFRSHPAQRSQQKENYRRQALAALQKYGNVPSWGQDRFRRLLLQLPPSLRQALGRQYIRHPSLLRRLRGLYPSHLYAYDSSSDQWKHWTHW